MSRQSGMSVDESSLRTDMIERDDVGVYRVSREELLIAIRHDCVTFFAFYLREELSLEVPDVHKEIWAELLDYLEMARDPKFIKGFLRKLFCVPRGHAKTTLVKLAIILFMRYSPLRFVVYASNTIAMGIQAIKDIVKWLASEQEENLYGKRADKWIEKANESQALWIVHIETPEYGRKRIILKALGSDTQVRGMLIDNIRPELMIFDDCEDYSTCSTDVTQKRLDQWMLGAALKARAKKSLVIILGNLISEKTLLCRLSRQEEWKPTVFGAIVRDKKTGQVIPLWPGLYSVEELIADYKEHRKVGDGHIWVHEMMNLTAEKIYGMDMVNAVTIPQPTPDQISSGMIVIDPAFGLEAFHDRTALTVHVQIKEGYYGHGIPHIVQVETGHWTEDQMLDQLLQLSFYWGLKTWCMETTAAQRLFIPLFRNMMTIRQLNPDAILILPITGGITAKPSRIKALRDSVSSGSYGIVWELTELFDKLASYNPTIVNQNDDDIDSAALGIIGWGDHQTVIEAAGIVHVIHELMSSPLADESVSQLDFSPY